MKSVFFKILIISFSLMSFLVYADDSATKGSPTTSEQGLQEVITSEDKKELEALDRADSEGPNYVSFLGIVDLPKAVIEENFLLSAGLSRFESAYTDGNEKWYTMPMVHVGVQFFDNMWIEGSFGQKDIGSFPAVGLDTKLRTAIVKAKYTFGLPSEFYVQIYGGHLHARGKSPGAGVGDGMTSAAVLAEETETVARMNEDKFIYGITMMKELPYGWIIKGDLGRDVRALSLGMLF